MEKIIAIFVKKMDYGSVQVLKYKKRSEIDVEFKAFVKTYNIK